MPLGIFIIRNFLEPFSYLVYALAFYLKARRGRLGLDWLLLAYYLAGAALLTAANFLVLHPLPDMLNDWMYNVVYFLTICVLSWYFLHLLTGRWKKLFLVVALIVNTLIFFVYELLLGHFLNDYNSIVYAISFICIVIYSFLYFSQLLGNVTEKSITREFDFWLVSGYLLYFLGAFIIILLYRTVPFAVTGDVWVLQNVILFIGSLITLTGYLNTSGRRRFF